MSLPNTQTVPKDEIWAVVSLMGHGETAGRISKTSEWGGLIRIDVPDGDAFRTELYGLQAVYSVKFVSEEIARAYATQPRVIEIRDAPIVSREMHEAAVSQMRRINDDLAMQVRELQRRLTAVRALPAPQDEGEDPEVEPGPNDTSW